MEAGAKVKLSELFKDSIRMATMNGYITGWPLDDLDSFQATVLESDADITTVETPDGDFQIFATRNLAEA